MEYNFRDIEKKWQRRWKESGAYKVENDFTKPKCYVLDMFPYPSGAGLHVGHPLGYIASDIYARYKRLKGFNVLHPMGYDSFGLPAEQYALETGQHPAVTTENNIKNFREQLDNIGFSFDWSREVRTSDPKYYRWTQWIFLRLFNSWYDVQQNKARGIDELVKLFEKEGNSNTNGHIQTKKLFTAGEWKNFSEAEKMDMLMEYRLAYSAFGEVNWCEALGTVLANDEVINGVSERGGHPVVKKKMRQWYLRITAYADRLLQGLEKVDFSDAMKEMQRNWIGKSQGAEIVFDIAESLIPNPSPEAEGNSTSIKTAEAKVWPQLKDLPRQNRKEKTEAENILWQRLRNNQLGSKVRRQHVIGPFIVDFAFLNERLLIEINGEYHNEPEQKKYDDARREYLLQLGYRLIRFTNDEVEKNIAYVIEKIKNELKAFSPLSRGRGAGGEALILTVYTTRPDTIFGVDFMVLAPEHDLVEKITTPEQRARIDEYLNYVKSRSERERLAEVKQVTGEFTGAYAINPFDGRKIPIWIAEYVLAGYGTGAIMAVPCGDQRDYDFATHFNIPITNIIGDYYNGKEANPTKEATLINSGFLNGMKMTDAFDVVLNKIEEEGIGKRKVNYKMRDAGFSRQRYWGEPFPIIYHNGIAYALDDDELPVTLPHVEHYKPGPEGEGPLANVTDWVNVNADDVELGDTYLNLSPGKEISITERASEDLTPNPSPKERGEEPHDYITSDATTWKSLKPFARENRKNQTTAEKLLWANLRNRNLSNEKFRRQHAIGGFIVDFVCIEKMLVIEIDGEYHNSNEQVKYDAERTKYLNEHGFHEIRFSNDEVEHSIHEVLEKIRAALRSRSPLPGRGVRGEVNEMYTRETNTMPGYAGSSWYFLRYMDPHNDHEFAGRKATDYWNQVDVYVGGTEHAVGHLLYSRMWTKVLYDLNLIGFDEPYKKLINQGMIQGSSRFVYRLNGAGLEIMLRDLLSIFNKYNFTTTGFNDPKFFDFIGTFNGKTFGIEITDSGNIQRKLDSYNLKKSIIGDTIFILISSGEFILHKSNGDLEGWFRSILTTERNYISTSVENISLFLSKSITDKLDPYCYNEIHVDVNYVDGLELNIDAFRKSKLEYNDACFILEDGKIFSPGEDLGKVSSKYICGAEVEKMSKSKLNAVSPYVHEKKDENGNILQNENGLVVQYGADTFRMYEMFLGPVEASKPWDTKGIEGVHRFLKKLWRLFFDEEKGKVWNTGEATDAELKILHKAIKKIEDDTARFSYNTAVSAFMVCVNELSDAKCHKKEILEPLLILLAPYAPHIAEELYHQINSLSFGEGRGEVSILTATYPKLEEKYLIETEKEYPVSVNGKLRTTIKISLDASQSDVEKIALGNDVIQKWMEGKQPKKIIFVKNKMINVVV